MGRKTKEILLNLFSITAIVVVPHLGFFQLFSYSIPLLLLVWLALKYSGETFSNIGFRWKSFSGHALLVGIAAGVISFILLQLLLMPTLDHFFNLSSVDLGVASFVQQGIGSLIFLMSMGFLIGGFYEEIVFHGFIFTRIEKLIPGKGKTVIAFFIAAILFSVYHIQMGANGTINAFFAGMAYQGIYLYFKRNLWYSIICHGTYNSVVMTALYLGYL